jgi:glycerophosphoryl diester phosphodiesterase
MTVVRPLLSAHRGGPGPHADRENTLAALLDAVAVDCEYVEFDVQRCRGGVHVLHHDATVTVDGRAVPVATLTFEQFARHAGPYLLLEDALAVLRDRKKLHLDLKFLSDPDDGGDEPPGHEVLLVRHVVEVMGAENLIVTTAEDESVRLVRSWSRDRHPGLLVGLSLGGTDVSPRHPLRLVATRLSELFPGRRIRRCGANLVVSEKTLARLRIARWAWRHRMPLLVWTVDSAREQRAWLADPRVWLLTTNYPRRAAELRRRLGAAPPGPTTRGRPRGAGAPPRRAAVRRRR